MCKIAVCVASKYEEEYLIEWIEYYKKLGFDNIIFYDNNGKDNNSQYNLLLPYIKQNFLIYKKHNVVNQPKLRAFQHCYKTHLYDFDYILFCDLDDFIEITGYKNIKEYINSLNSISNYNGILIQPKNNTSNTRAIVKTANTKDIVWIYAFSQVNKHSIQIPQNKSKTLEYFNAENIVNLTKITENRIINQIKNGDPKENKYCKHLINTIDKKTEILKSIVSEEKFKEYIPILKRFGGVFEDNNIKIDYVFPFVDDTDDIWFKSYLQYTNVKDYNGDSGNGLVRYKSFDLLQYAFRTIEKNMPWINNVYLLVACPSQVPKWINTDNVKIIYHKDFIPEEYLPTFSSSAIEMFLWNIPGISEYFLYGNDDFYITSPISKDMFFRNKKPLLTMYIRPMVYKTSNVSQLADYLCINATKTIFPNETSVFHTMHHIKPMLKSKCFECFVKYKELLLNSISRFREPKNFNQYLYHFYNIANNTFYPYNLNYVAVSHESKNVYKKDIILDSIQNHSKLLSLDFSENITESDVNIVHYAFLEQYPEKSKYEK